jgi:hypothetical protein
MTNAWRGWQLRVDGEVPPVRSARFTDELSAAGSGQASVDLDHPWWVKRASAILEGAPSVWVFSLDGVDRFAWVGESLSEQTGHGPSTTATVSGRGVAGELDRALMLPENYPNHSSLEREFTGVAPLAIWRTLLGEAHDRNMLTSWSTSFSDSADSDGVSWAKTFDFRDSAGGDVLSLLGRLAEAAECEWHAGPDRVLHARQTWQVDRTREVRWYVQHQLQRQRGVGRD